MRLRVDPRRHTLRIAPVLRIRTDTLFTPAADTLRSLAAGFTSPPGGRMLAVSRDTAGRLLGIRTFAAGERLTIGRGLCALEWTFYLLDDSEP